MKDYFEIDETDNTYYPVILFKSTRYRDIPIRAKFLYGILYEKMGKAKENSWFDEDGVIYVDIEEAEIDEAMRSPEDEVERYLLSLEAENLIRREIGKVYIRKVAEA